MATIDYMICAYGPYAASATGGNGWARDFLAGVLTLPATPFYENIGGKNHLAYASTILFCISVLLVISVYIIYWKGPVLRARSPFAQQLNSAREEHHAQNESRRASIASAGAGAQPERPGKRPVGSRSNSFVYATGASASRNNSFIRPGASRNNSFVRPAASRNASRANSLV